MPIFNFYSFENRPSGESKDLFKGDPTLAQPKPYTTPEECFGSFFVSHHSFQLPVLRQSGKGAEKGTAWAKYKCDVMRHEDGIVLMTVENNKVKHTIVDKKDRENEHHPYCMVVIDNRPDRQIIGIERNSAFDSQPDKVAAILKKGMDCLMAPYRREIVLTHLKKKSTEFWPVVNELRTKFKDVVKQIRLDFKGQEDDPDGGDTIRIISALARKAESEAVFMLNAPDEGEVKLQEVYDDLTNMADICLRQRGYDLTVKFRNFGVYRYGADLLAQFGVAEEVLTQFEEGVRVFDFDSGMNQYELVDWLNKLAELLNGYKKHAISEGRKNRRRR